MQSKIIHRVLPWIDRVGYVLGHVAMVMIIILITLMLYEVISRRVFDAPTMWANDISYMSNGTLFLMGAAYTLRRGGHIRIDFLSTRFPLRVQHSINLAFYLGIFLPTLGLTSYFSIVKAHKAFLGDEIETMSAWEPLIWPFLLGIAVGVTSLTIQVTLEAIRHVFGIYDPDCVPGPSDSEPA